MSRPWRIEFSGALYHILSRGNEEGDLFGLSCSSVSKRAGIVRKRLRAVPFPYIEIHMTNIEKRGIRSILAETGVGIIAGFGVESYVLGLEAMLKHMGFKGVGSS
jgi:3-dehydroquinate dehydratase